MQKMNEPKVETCGGAKPNCEREVYPEPLSEHASDGSDGHCGLGREYCAMLLVAVQVGTRVCVICGVAKQGHKQERRSEHGAVLT